MAGCQAVTATKLKGGLGERLLSPGVMAAEGAMLTTEIATKGAMHVLCQHKMELMEQQLRNMVEYNSDLGW